MKKIIAQSLVTGSSHDVFMQNIASCLQAQRSNLDVLAKNVPLSEEIQYQPMITATGGVFFSAMLLWVQDTTEAVEDPNQKQISKLEGADVL